MTDSPELIIHPLYISLDDSSDDSLPNHCPKPGLKVKTQRHFLQVAEKWELSAANADLQNRLQTMAITYMQGRPDDNMLQVLLHTGYIG